MRPERVAYVTPRFHPEGEDSEVGTVDGEVIGVAMIVEFVIGALEGAGWLAA